MCLEIKYWLDIFLEITTIYKNLNAKKFRNIIYILIVNLS